MHLREVNNIMLRRCSCAEWPRTSRTESKCCRYYNNNNTLRIAITAPAVITDSRLPLHRNNYFIYFSYYLFFVYLCYYAIIILPIVIIEILRRNVVDDNILGFFQWFRREYVDKVRSCPTTDRFYFSLSSVPVHRRRHN